MKQHQEVGRHLVKLHITEASDVGLDGPALYIKDQLIS